jgi:16S rRNA (uracil1498-N3)-methyltransferase
MNLLLFHTAELCAPLTKQDARAKHLLTVLRRGEGDTFDAGVVNGARGKGTIEKITEDALTLTFAWGAAPAPLEPIALLIGLPRPQTSRDILRDATTLGAAELHFVSVEKGDPNYASSTLWSSGEWQRHLLAGAEQAFDTRVPIVTHGQSLEQAIAALPSTGTRLALDNYESPQALSKLDAVQLPAAIAFGPERGWSGRERDLLRSVGFTFVHLGTRVLRTESAVLAALTLLRAKLGLM